MTRLLRHRHLVGRRDNPMPLPSPRLEYAYYFALTYSVLGPALGLDIPILGGAMILGIALLCIQQFRSRADKIYAPLALLLAAITSMLLIQVAFHGQSLLDSSVRPFITWMLGLIIIQTLCLRPGFTYRYPLILFVLGALTVPFLTFTAGKIEMARVDLAVQGGLSHPGGLAEWFGFCAVYFAVVGLESERPPYRYGAWLLAVACLFIVTLTVERAPLFATLLALAVGLRRLLKRGFVPVVMLIIAGAVITQIGLFDQALSQYSERGLENTGREKLWPEALERIWASPFVGEGISNALIRLSPRQAVPPHNIFLYVALCSGVVPVTLFVAFWIKVFWNVLRRKDTSFLLPYLIFTFVVVMAGDFSIISPWALLTLSMGAGSILGDARHHNGELAVLSRGHSRINRRQYRPAQSVARQ